MLQNISSRVDQIAASAKEQSTGVAEINVAMNQMDQVTQQNAAMVEQSTAASHSLGQEADKLMGLISQFKTDATASANNSRPAPVPTSVPTSVKEQQARAASFANDAQQQRTSKLRAAGAGGAVAEDDWEDF